MAAVRKDGHCHLSLQFNVKYFTEGRGTYLPYLQILWLVGTGQVTPNMEAIRADTPSQLRKLVMDCIQYERDKRPLFQYVLGVVEEMMRTLPKIHRSMSEPILNRPGVTSGIRALNKYFEALVRLQFQLRLAAYF